MNVSTERLGRRMEELARIGASPGGGVSRLGLTNEEEAARKLVGGWARDRGAMLRRDAAANLFARFGGPGPAVLIGSHLDSVPDGGRYDGALGVLCAVEAVETLLDAGVTMRVPVEVVAWADEEGARFGIGVYGSAAAFGRLPQDAAERRDREGTSMRDALRALGESGDPTAARRDAREVRAYLELHIEQSERLAAAGQPLGVVSTIVGILQGRVSVSGRADHAGATTMGDRHDALAAAAELVSALERIARDIPEAVATVGELMVRPGAKNVIPGTCIFSTDMRAPDQATIARIDKAFRDEARSVAAARGVTVSIDLLGDKPPAPLDLSLRETLVRACASAGAPVPPALVSRAGHDAANAHYAGVPSGMVFVRSTGGSHTSREHTDMRDAALGAAALAHALHELAV